VAGFGDSNPVADARKELLTDLLKQVSRSFYLTLRVLPAAVRSQIGLAYLLARSTDTIADTEVVPVEQRLAALAALRARILGQSEAPLHFGELAQQQGLPAERALLERIEDSLALVRILSAEDLALVRQVIDKITGGQELDLRRFAGSAAAPAVIRRALVTNAGDATTKVWSVAPEPGALPIIALQQDADLDDYTYRVAGCVGEFWTKMCRSHLFPDAKLDDAQLLADGVRFGKGLQLVNILRDLPRDLRQGRCYIPAELLAAQGMQPADLLSPAAGPEFRPVYEELLDQAQAHLAAGWNYTNALPTNQWRVRLACAWPILIGVRTIGLLRTENVLDPERRIKITRAEVRDLMLRTLVHVPFPGKFRALWVPSR
jgi:farnesyl-diphosphate farnesyltransferase